MKFFALESFLTEWTSSPPYPPPPPFHPRRGGKGGPDLVSSFYQRFYDAAGATAFAWQAFSATVVVKGQLSSTPPAGCCAPATRKNVRVLYGWLRASAPAIDYDHLPEICAHQKQSRRLRRRSFFGARGQIRLPLSAPAGVLSNGIAVAHPWVGQCPARAKRVLKGRGGIGGEENLPRNKTIPRQGKKT